MSGAMRKPELEEYGLIDSVLDLACLTNRI